jgi:hypothetical protein
MISSMGDIAVAFGLASLYYYLLLHDFASLLMTLVFAKMGWQFRAVESQIVKNKGNSSI